MLARHWKEGWLAAGCAIVLVCWAQWAAGLLDPLQKAWTAWSVRQVPLPPANEVLLITIDDSSLQSLGAWPWPRELQARLIDRLTEAEAGAIAFAVPWSGPEPREALNQLSRLAEAVAADPALSGHSELTGWMQQSQVLLDGDSRLAQSLQQNRRTVAAVGPASAADTGWPIATLSSAAFGVGHIDFSTDVDGLVHGWSLLEQRGDRWLPSLSLAAVAAWRQTPIEQLHWQRDAFGRRTAVLGTARWAVDARGRVEPMWPATPDAAGWIAEWPAAALLAGRQPPGNVKGRLVVVGLQNAEPAAGWRPTLAGDRSTAYLVAAAAAALIHDHLLARPEWAQAVAHALVLAIALYLVLALPRLHPRSRWALSALVAVLMVVGSHLAVVGQHVEVPVALPMAVLIGGHLAFAWAHRDVAAPTSRPPSRAGTAGHVPAASTPPQGPAQIAVGHRPTVPAPLGPPAAPPPTAAAVVRAPLLGEFELETEIGRGAMGRVHRARHVGTGEVVAVKTLALGREFDGFALQEAQSRFQREALAASRLQHPDIVRILATGENAGLVWIAMELLEGHDLVRHTIDGQLLPVPVVLEICARIAAALAHAHRHGVVHRDIKPANVMVDLDKLHQRRPIVKVTDFGIARITDAARTRTGLVLGSPSYMSPEHLAGRAVDGRSDLYSLGVLLFQLLTGRLPFQGATVAELMHAVAHVQAPDVRSLRPRLPEAVSNIVALALEKRPELRYADGLQMALDLRCVAAMWPPMRPSRQAPAAAPTSTTV